MKYAPLIYVAFYSAIAVAVIVTESAMPLWAMILAPSLTSSKADNATDDHVSLAHPVNPVVEENRHE